MKPYYDSDGITIFHGDCLDVLSTLETVDHALTDPPYARDVYARLSAPNSRARSADAKDIGLGRTMKLNNGARIAALVAGEIGHIDEMLDPVAVELARLVLRWALVFSDVETCHRWRLALEGSGMRYVRTGAWVKPDPMPQEIQDMVMGFDSGATRTDLLGRVWKMHRENCRGGMDPTLSWGQVKAFLSRSVAVE